jgi:hypothetical protein
MKAELAESQRSLSVCSKGFDAMCKRALAAELRVAALDAFLVKVLPAGIEDVCDECGGDMAKCKAENPDCYIAEARRLLPTPDYDPTPWCSGCGAMRKTDCHCGPIAENE